MFTIPLFTIAKIRKQPKCPLMNEWIKKIQYVRVYIHTHKHTHTTEYSSAIKKNNAICSNMD